MIPVTYPCERSGLRLGCRVCVKVFAFSSLRGILRSYGSGGRGSATHNAVSVCARVRPPPPQPVSVTEKRNLISDAFSDSTHNVAQTRNRLRWLALT